MLKRSTFNVGTNSLIARSLRGYLKNIIKNCCFIRIEICRNFWEAFQQIADCKKYDIQDVLKRAALMITDYSSVFFDFAYMRKPVIFYQFDEKEFREKQYGEGYLDYHDTVLGSWSDSLPHTLELLEKQIISGIKPVEEAVIRQFFPLWDSQNCKRTYESIASI